MNKHFQEIILKATGAKEAFEIEVIQNLWSGYGEIVRMGLKGSHLQSVVVKHVKLNQGNHPRGWNTDLSHQRKLKSYQIETEWYKIWSAKCGTDCRVPKCLALEATENEVLMVLEDLDNSGFSKRRTSIGWNEVETCISWLANFHATFLHQKPQGLWETGTYWHLETRPEELEELTDFQLKSAAGAIDQKLSESPFQTFVHGDAKLANFCFSDTGQKVAAVDFQYVGGGCGMKDLAYFTGSCMNESESEHYETKILDYYFEKLKNALSDSESGIDFDALENNWRGLYHFAWADFHRFLKGWSPGHWKINSYSEKVTRKVIHSIQQK